MFSQRRRRVVLHLADPSADTSLPSIEGVLLKIDRVFGEYVIAKAELHVAAGAQPLDLVRAEELRVPMDRVAFYEVLR